MSYSVSIPATPKNEVGTALTTAGEAAVEQASEEFRPSQLDHIHAAVAAVDGLIKTVGRDDDLVKVSLSGHSNPDHAPLGGWSDEFVNVSVYVIPADAT